MYDFNTLVEVGQICSIHLARYCAVIENFQGDNCIAVTASAKYCGSFSHPRARRKNWHAPGIRHQSGHRHQRCPPAKPDRPGRPARVVQTPFPVGPPAPGLTAGCPPRKNHLSRCSIIAAIGGPGPCNHSVRNKAFPAGICAPPPQWESRRVWARKAAVQSRGF